MPANIDPIYTRQGDVSSDALAGSPPAMAPTFTTAAADYDGTTATHNKVVFTAGSNGAYIERLRFKAKGTNTASVARIFLNNGSTPGTAANNSFFGEITLPATTISAVSATAEIEYPMNIAIPAGFKIIVGLGTTVAAGVVCTPIGGQY